jgi:arsenate reductase
MADTKPYVLFLCTHNAARSQLAEALCRRYTGDRFEVASAGLAPTDVHRFTQRVLREIGLDPSGLWAKDLKSFLGRVLVTYAIIVCDKVERDCPRLYPFALQTLYWPFDDPTQAAGTLEQCLKTFRAVRDQIDARVRTWLRQQDAAEATDLALQPQTPENVREATWPKT